ncbi:nucleotidyltransferase family protein [Anaerostipes sp.]|uniref:nucleotidyltransferase family protein n=1 Tax=Anaerostipes sp. TaxID=1872530 RepID=UPI0025C01EAD|nr:nucleotidyltransferase family protein [Anaerostipes sp.]MBS7007752.1 nucleotidyltransferase family protein [Anaerostipes sp.]
MKIHMILLAAGFSSRFGSNKLLYPVDGKAMFLHTMTLMAELAEELKEADVSVVTRYQEISDEAEKMGIRCLINSHSERGISSSMQIGLKANLEDEDYYAFFTADQPSLKKETVRKFLCRFLESGKGIGCVSVQGTAKNPCVFHSCYAQELLSIQGDRGGKQVVNRHPEDVFLYEIREEEAEDIDTPDKMK